VKGEFVPLREYLAALHIEREKFAAERDRRYAEVSVEREKALKIKEVADLAALQLAREIQTYKDEKANELRSQIERERGSYATQTDLKSAMDKIEALIKPLGEFVSSQQGRSLGTNTVVAYLLAVAAVVVAAVSLITR
jgi:preprotein translocase subunit SecF